MTKSVGWKAVWALYVGGIAVLFALVATFRSGPASTRAVLAAGLAILVLGCHLALLYRSWFITKRSRTLWGSVQRGFWVLLLCGYGVVAVALAYKFSLGWFRHP
jgi:hypothetical protein